MTDIKVRYRGLSDVRIIKQSDLDARSISVGKDLVWEAGNGWTLVLPYSEQLEALLLGEGHFSIEKINDTGEAEMVAEAPEPEREPDLVVDGNTGQKSRAKK